MTSTFIEDSYEGRKLTVTARELEYTRQRSDPRAGQLVGYVLDPHTIRGSCARAAIPWQRGVFERVRTLDGYIAGWAPLEAVAEALDIMSAKLPDKLRRLGPSDVSEWTTVVFGGKCAVVRTSLRELAEADLWMAEQIGMDDDDEVYEREADEDKAARAEEGNPPRAVAVRDACEHDHDGYATVSFDEGETEPRSVTPGCSKCGRPQYP